MYIGVIPVKGTITQRLYSSMKPVLDYVAKKNKVRGVIIHINSGGGEAVASELFYNHFMDIAAKKPVFAYIEGVGASGAYWVALAAQKIYAFSGSVIGSIGVVSIIPNVKGLMQKLGIDIQSVKIGEYKDALSPFSSDTTAGKEMLTKIMRESYERFVSIVKARRRITDAAMEKIAQGQVFSVSESMENRLLDNVGTFTDVIDDMSRVLAGLRKYRVLTPPRPFLARMFDSTFSDMSIESFLGTGHR